MRVMGDDNLEFLLRRSLDIVRERKASPVASPADALGEAARRFAFGAVDMRGLCDAAVEYTKGHPGGRHMRRSNLEARTFGADAPRRVPGFPRRSAKLILDVCCGGASREEAEALIAVAELRGLNPITQECYFVQRWDSAKNRKVWAVQVSIDAMRIKAEESGVYSGQDEPEYEYGPDKVTPVLARVRVYRRDWDRPCVAVARYGEYVQRKKDGQPTKFWKDMPHNQLAKCAEALALRKAFPARLAKLYTSDEMAQASNDQPSRDDEMVGEVVPPPARLAPAPAPQPPPKQDSPEAEAAYETLARRMTLAGDEAALAIVWKEVLGSAKAGRITLTMRAQLADLKDARKAALKNAPPPSAADVLGDNEMPAGWGGEKAEPCLVCGKPAAGKMISTTTNDGVVGTRHEGCSPFGAGGSDDPDEGP